MSNILYISRFLPSRKDLGGGGVRTRLLWEALKQAGDVYTVIYGERNERLDSHTASYHPEHAYWGNMCEGHLWRLTGKYGNMVINPCYTPMPLKEWFPDVHFDFAVGRYFNGFNDVRPWKNGIKTFVDVDDHPWELLKDKTAIPGYWKKRIAMELQLRYLEHKVRGGWIVKESDRSYLHHPENYDLLPNIPPEVPTDYNLNCCERKQALLTVALFSYPPNRNGVDDFLEKIWPDVKTKYPGMEYWLVGGGLPEDYKARWGKVPGVRLWGYVENLNQVYEQCFAVVVPVSQGAGSCIKTIEALSRGRVVLSTPCGVRGYERYSTTSCFDDELSPDSAKPIRLCESAQDFVNELEKLKDSSLRQRLENAAIAAVKDDYSFEVFSKRVKNRLFKE